MLFVPWDKACAFSEVFHCIMVPLVMASCPGPEAAKHPHIITNPPPFWLLWCYWVKNYSIRNTQAFPLSAVLALHQIYSMSFPYPFCQCQYRANLWISTFDWSVHKNILPKDLEGHQSVLWQMFFSCITPVDFCSLADCRTFVFLNSLTIDSHSL